MQLDLVYSTCAILIFLGICGMLLRRNMIIIAFCSELVFLGAILLLGALASSRGDVGLVGIGIVLVFGFAVLNLVALGVILLVYRQRATLNLEELRELRE